jgi:mannosyltransferase
MDGGASTAEASTAGTAKRVQACVKHNLNRYLVTAILTVAASVRLAAALRRPLYADEGLSLTVSALPVGQELDFLRHDFHPPLFFLGLHSLESVDAPIWLLRVCVVLFGVISVALLMLVVREWSTWRAAVIAGAVAALMPSLVFYDNWLRMYSLLSALQLGAIYVLSVLATRSLGRAQRLWLWSAWIAVNAAALYSHYLAAMSLVAQVLFALAMRRRLFVQTLVCAAIAVIVWLPQFTTFAFQLNAGGVSFGGFQTHVAMDLWQLPGQATVDPLVEGWAAQAFSVAVWIWIALALAGAWPRMKTTVLPWLAVPALLTMAYSLTAHKDLSDARYFLLSAYALAAWTGVAIDRLSDVRKAVAACCAIGVPLAIVGCGYAFAPALYTSDWPRAAAIVRALARPSDLIIFEPGAGDWAFRYYADERTYRIVTVSTPSDIRHAIAQLDRERRVWLIGSGIRGVDPELRLPDALQKRFGLAYFEESKRSLPSQDVEVGLFVRKKR